MVENGRADVGRDGLTRLARPNYQARTGQEAFMLSAQLTTSKIGNLTRLIHTRYSLYRYMFTIRMRPDSHTQLPNHYMRPFSCFFGDADCVIIVFSFILYGDYVVRFFSEPDGVFLPCDHGLFIFTPACMRIQSTNHHITLMGVGKERRTLFGPW